MNLVTRQSAGPLNAPALREARQPTDGHPGEARLTKLAGELTSAPGGPLHGMSDSEQKLLSRIRRGDQAALGELLESYQHRLYSVSLRMIGNRDDAAELTQDAMLKIIQHIDGYNGQAALSTWMIRIVMNLSISHLRKRRLRHTASLDSSGRNDGREDQSAGLREQLPDDREPDPVQSVQRHEMIAQLHQCLNCLDDDFRAVLVLRDLNEMDYQQIGEVLQIPVGTVKSRLFRARLALRQRMQDAPGATASAAAATATGDSANKADPAVASRPLDSARGAYTPRRLASERAASADGDAKAPAPATSAPTSARRSSGVDGPSAGGLADA